MGKPPQLQELVMQPHGQVFCRHQTRRICGHLQIPPERRFYFELNLTPDFRTKGAA